MRGEEIDLAFVIADLSGYTALTEAHGNVQAARAVTRFRALAQDAIELEARLLDCIGDELLIASESPVVAVRTAVRLRAVVESEPLFPVIRAGIHHGAVAEADGRYYGAALNLTARVASHARGGQILCTASVAEAASTLEEARFLPIGRVEFKNVVDPVALCEVLSGTGADETTAVDPVCRMQVRPDSASARLPFDGKTFFFCSFDCARAFAGRPERYAAR